MGLLVNQTVSFSDYNYSFTTASYINVRDVRLKKEDEDSENWIVYYKLQIYTSQSSNTPLMKINKTLSISIDNVNSIFTQIYNSILSDYSITEYTSV